MTTINEAIELAKQEQAAGFIRSYYSENGKVYAFASATLMIIRK